MPFAIVEREETLVAGLAVRSPKRALGKARDKDLEKTWSTLLAQNVDRPLASAYVDHAPEINSYYTQIVGYECSSIDQVGALTWTDDADALCTGTYRPINAHLSAARPSGDRGEDVDDGLRLNRCREIAGLAVHEHVDVPTKHRPAVDEPIAEAGYRSAELDQQVADRVARDVVALFDAGKQREERPRQKDRGHDVSPRRPPIPRPRSPAACR